MKISKKLIVLLTLSLIFSWEWPWSFSKKNDEFQIKLPKGSHSIISVDSNIEWKGQKAIGGSHNGDLQIKYGKIQIDTKDRISGVIVFDMNTINCTDLEGEWKHKLDGHLKSDDFFSVNKYNESKIEFQSVERNGNIVHFDGNLTIKNISKPLSFNATLKETQGMILATSNLVFDRSKYNIKYGSGTFFDDLGDNLILDDIFIDIDLAINK